MYLSIFQHQYENVAPGRWAWSSCPVGQRTCRSTRCQPPGSLACLPTYLSYRSINRSVHIFLPISFYPSSYLSIHLSVYISIHLSIYTQIYLTISLSIYIRVYPCASIIIAPGQWVWSSRQRTCRNARCQPPGSLACRSASRSVCAVQGSGFRETR